MEKIRNKLEQILTKEQIKEQEPMSRHTTFRVGGPASWMVVPNSCAELSQILELCRREKLPFYILGNGSNLLVGDGGYRGVMVKLGPSFQKIQVEENLLSAGAGAMLAAASKQALSSSLTGLEFAAGIPGTIGGAVVMNAGAYGSDMSQVMKQAVVLTPEGKIETVPVQELELGYRTSCIQERGYIVLEVQFRLESKDAEQIRRKMEELAQLRRSKQPLEYASAGSTFKRPKGFFAGKLIQDAGLRGKTVGDAQVSEKHCGFVINRGEASAADIMELCSLVKQRVQEYAGVSLELEVKTLGEF